MSIGGSNREGEGTEAGGAARISDESPVMELERGGTPAN
jgi:hypothetical protein